MKRGFAAHDANFAVLYLASPRSLLAKQHRFLSWPIARGPVDQFLKRA
jgi:hypothetical protein